MYKPLLVIGLWAAAQPGWGQSCAFSNTTGQTQPVRDPNCIELGDNFSSASEIDITITPNPSLIGQWAKAHWGFANDRTDVPNNVFIGIHTSVLPNGLVLSWQGHNDNEFRVQSSPTSHPGTDIYRWDPGLNRLSTTIFHLDWTNAFCTGHSFLADGKLLVTGGHDQTIGPVTDPITKAVLVPGYIKGLPHASTYDYTINPDAIRPNTVHDPLSWQVRREMVRNRWYPTNTTLRNGDVLTTAGETEPTQILPNDQRFPELWQNGNWTSLTGAPKTLPTYPWMFQAPNGQVFYAGPGNELSYVNPYYVDPATQKKGTWTDVEVPGRPYGPRGQGTAAMFWPGRILVVGGSDGASVTNTVETIDLTAGTNGSVVGADGGTYLRPVVAVAAPLRYARHNVNATLLPDGTVLVTGGSRVPGFRDKSQGVLEAEIWTPTAGPNGPTGPGTWTTVASMAEARMYHSTAALLPDGRVLSAGGEEVIKYNPFRPNIDNHCTAELYSPPYLSRGPRPVISYAPALAATARPSPSIRPTRPPSTP